MLIARDVMVGKTGVLHLQSLQMMDGITFVVQCSHFNIEKWKEGPKKALLEKLMSELNLLKDQRKRKLREKEKVRETGMGLENRENRSEGTLVGNSMMCSGSASMCVL